MSRPRRLAARAVCDRHPVHPVRRLPERRLHDGADLLRRQDVSLSRTQRSSPISRGRRRSGKRRSPPALADVTMPEEAAMTHTVVTMPGDGIGTLVLPEAIRVLDAVGFQPDYVHADIGWECWREQGDPLPQATIDLLAEHKLGLFGAITSKPKAVTQAELSPELQGQGHVYFSPIVSLRQRFGLDICVRPCRSY